MSTHICMQKEKKHKRSLTTIGQIKNLGITLSVLGKQKVFMALPVLGNYLRAANVFV